MSEINYYFDNKHLCAELYRYNEIVIYGTGKYARSIYPQLIKFGLREKIVSFTQTKEHKLDLIDGIPIVLIKNLKCSKKRCVILLAVSELSIDEIRKMLFELGYKNIVNLVDYQIDYRRHCALIEEDFHKLVSFKEYCEFIAEWYVETCKSDLDKESIIYELLERGKCSNEKIDSKLIVVICGYLTSRTIKLIGALKRKKYNIVMLSYCIREHSWNMTELEKMKIKIYKCQRIEELLYMALQYSPLVYLFEPRWGDCRWAEVMIRQKIYFGKVILALYDVMNDAYVGVEEDKLKSEKNALECADGILWRWFSKEYLEKKGFCFQGKSIQFIDYCSHTNFDDVSFNENSSIVKICFVTGKGDPIIEGIQYTGWALIGEILEKIGNRKDCIFHFYAGILSHQNIEKCKQYEKQYNNFRFFIATEHNELLNRLKHYDYGCDLWRNENVPLDVELIGKYYGSVYKNSIRNVYFDFLSAGLPVITTLSLHLWDYLSEYDIVVPMNLNNLDIDYLRHNRKYYRINVENARKELDIDNQIMRLIQFFGEV